MQARGYSPAFSTGVVSPPAATLGALLPPASGPLILFALLSQASVGQLFVAALIPGLLATALYLLTIAIYVRVSPSSAPLSTDHTPGRFLAALARCGPAALSFGSVLGGVLFRLLHRHRGGRGRRRSNRSCARSPAASSGAAFLARDGGDDRVDRA